MGARKDARTRYRSTGEMTKRAKAYSNRKIQTGNTQRRQVDRQTSYSVRELLAASFCLRCRSRHRADQRLGRGFFGDPHPLPGLEVAREKPAIAKPHVVAGRLPQDLAPVAQRAAILVRILALRRAGIFDPSSEKPRTSRARSAARPSPSPIQTVRGDGKCSTSNAPHAATAGESPRSRPPGACRSCS